MTLVLTLDLDGLSEYAAIHGLSQGPQLTATAPSKPNRGPNLAQVDTQIDGHIDRMYDLPHERFTRLCQAAGGTGTLFAIARDVCGSSAATLRELNKSGYEIASHSLVHDYHLSRNTYATISEDVRRARDVIGSAIGQAPIGFRAPGYHLSPKLLDALEEHGFKYDSSVFPSLPYYVVKAGVLAGYRILGKKSAALLGSAQMTLAPKAPYHPGKNPYRPGSRTIWELPISVAGFGRWPVTGASLCLAPKSIWRLMLSSLSKNPVVILNLHAMDLIDVKDVPQAIARRQPELKIGVGERYERLLATVLALALNRKVCTAAELITTLSG